jgi:hypothetical protein
MGYNKERPITTRNDKSKNDMFVNHTFDYINNNAVSFKNYF